MHSRELVSTLLVPISAREFVEDVVVLGQQLARQIQAHRVGAVRAHGARDAFSRQIQRGVPLDRLRCRAARDAPHRLQQPCVQRDGLAGSQVQRAALAAQAAEVGRMLGVAAHCDDAFPLALDHDTAAHAAVATG